MPSPQSCLTYNYLGYIEAQQGQLDLGIEHLRKVVSLMPGETNAHDSLGEVLLLAGKYGEAEASFQKAAELAPEEWMSWAGVAYARSFRGDLEGGRRAVQQALASKLDPHAALACRMLMAWSLLAEGKVEEALAAVAQAEAEARKKKFDYGTARAATDRADLMLLSGQPAKVDAVAAAADQAIRLASTLHISGQERNTLTRRALRAQLQAAAQRHDRAAVRTASARLEEAFAAAPSSEELRGTAHFARGILAAESGDPKCAQPELALCQAADYVCQLELAELQESQGDTSAAQHTRSRLLAANARDNLHRGEPPTYLVVRTKVARAKSR